MKTAQKRSKSNRPINRVARDRIERFHTTLNAIENHLRKACGGRREDTFSDLIRVFAKKNRGWRDRDALMKMKDLRNVLVHDRYEPYEYVAIPARLLVAKAEAIRDNLLRPSRVIPTFKKKVVAVDVSDSIVDVLALVHDHNFSQFPVYAGRRSVGLLTENGVVRWLARHVEAEDSLVEFNDIQVTEVLS